MKPTLKAPRTKRLKLKYDVPLSNFAFKFNLRRYSSAPRLATALPVAPRVSVATALREGVRPSSAARGAVGRSLHSASTSQLNLTNLSAER
jgi:hypothetical protein